MVTPSGYERSAHIGGSADLSTKAFLVVGLARDCSQDLKSDVRKLLAALSTCTDLRWLVIESDSNDDTVEKLRELESEVGKFRFISLGSLRAELPLRTERIAFCRNRYLEELKENPEYVHVDYVIVADLDGLNSRIDEESFASCWARQDWDVCTANQRGPYYDIWALRHKDWSPNDCWSQRKFLVDHGVSPEQALFASVHSRMIVIDPNSSWIEVESSFGGLAIYRREALANAFYVGVTDSGEEISEHVPMHERLRALGKRIFINPKLINAEYTEHSRSLLLGSRMKRRYYGMLKSVRTAVRAAFK